MSDEGDELEGACGGVFVAEKKNGLSEAWNGRGQEVELRCAELDEIAGPAVIIRLVGRIWGLWRSGKPA